MTTVTNGTTAAASSAEPRRRAARRSRAAVLLELGKAGLSGFVVVTTLVGFIVASRGRIDFAALIVTLAGTALTASGSLALNQWMEADRDARMRRTMGRPIPSGRLGRRSALGIATGSTLAGLAVLLVFVNPVTAVLALVVVLVYLLAYTPLKARTPACTLVGGICGAIPPMMGWAAATGGALAPGAWILGTTLFVWQIPHFLALAWLYRDDYQRGGFRMLPVVDPGGGVTTQMVILYTLALLPLGLLATLAGLGGWVFLAGSLVLGGWMLLLGIRLRRRRTNAAARKLFVASLVYLPFLLALLLADPGPIARAAGTVLR